MQCLEQRQQGLLLLLLLLVRRVRCVAGHAASLAAAATPAPQPATLATVQPALWRLLWPAIVARPHSSSPAGSTAQSCSRLTQREDLLLQMIRCAVASPATGSCRTARTPAAQCVMLAVPAPTHRPVAKRSVCAAAAGGSSRSGRAARCKQHWQRQVAAAAMMARQH
jgi:hypothetical protein